MFSVGSRVRLLSRIGEYPAGTEAVVVLADGDLCEIEIDVGHRLTIDCHALGMVEGARAVEAHALRRRR